MNLSNYTQQLNTAGKGLYLNYAATAPITSVTAACMRSEIELMTQPLGTRFYDTLNEIEHARRLIAELVHTNPKNIAFTLNTSMAISTLALSINFKPGDIVLVPDNEFPSNYFPWLNLIHKGVICKTFTPNPNEPLVDVLQRLDLSGVKLISISAVSYETGRLYELEELVIFCRKHDILVCLDAIQAIGSTVFDLQKIDPDFMCSGAQKWIMGPVGCGFLYVKPALLENLDVPFVGWTSHRFPEYMSLNSLDFPDEMTRFEPGLPNYLPIIGTASSLKQLDTIGWDSIFSSISQHSTYLRSSLKSAGFGLLADGDNQYAGITSFHIPDGLSSRIVGELYEKHRIKITSRNGYVRVSPHFFNKREELDHFLNVTESIFNKSAVSRVALAPTHVKTAKPEAPGKIMILGATGNLGGRFADLLVRQGFNLYLVSRDAEKLNGLTTQLRRTNSNVDIQYRAVDFLSADKVQTFIDELSEHGAKQFHALINCCSTFDADLFHQLPENNLRKNLLVNVDVPGRLMHLFLNRLRAQHAHGIMNVISSTGRCGSPLLANYGASHAALWTLGETLGREWADTDLSVTTFVAPAMHSPLQKLMGRTALRYFKLSGGFTYEEPDAVAHQALDAFWTGKAVHIASSSRLKLWTNALLPRMVNKKIRRMWRQKIS